MPNIHFLGNSGSFAISVIGTSLYIVTGFCDLESTVAFKKSSSLAIISSSPWYTLEVGSWNGSDGTFISSKWMTLIYSFRSNASSLARKSDTPLAGVLRPSINHFFSCLYRLELSDSSSGEQPSSSARIAMSPESARSRAI